MYSFNKIKNGGYFARFVASVSILVVEKAIEGFCEVERARE